LGLSTCPNDTFAFHALMAGEVDPRGLELAFELGDVEELNRRMLAGDLDATKASFHAGLLAGAERVVLRAGSALGFGVGPVVLAAPGRAEEPPRRVLAPGAHTTATLLWSLFHPGDPAPEQVVFSAIPPALAAGEADRGVCIHEARFTADEWGLEVVEDLGATWERATDAPLPLGGILAKRALGPDVLAALDAALADSIAWGHAHPDACLETMRTHAQEHSDDVLRAHVELYVNEWTSDLGTKGTRALQALGELARERGLLAADAPALEVRGA
jgi:1,4-dihydroxy-6-naphthoate synthase